METTDKNPETPQSPVAVLLAGLQEMVRKNELQALVIGFVKSDGGAAIQSTPMSAVMLNHLCRLIDRRVSREYDRALAQANGARPTTGAGAVPEVARQVAQLPRKVRREVQQRVRNLQKLAAKKGKTASEPIIRRTPSA